MAVWVFLPEESHEGNHGSAQGKLLMGGWGLESSGRKGGLRPGLRGPEQKGKSKI